MSVRCCGVAGVRPAGARRQVRAAQELGHHRLRRHADPRLQLQHAGARARLRGALGLRALHRGAPHAALHPHQQRCARRTPLSPVPRIRN